MLACEDYGDWKQYDSGASTVGVEILRRGVATAKKKASVAKELAFLLEKSGALEEAIQKLSMAIEHYDLGSPAKLVELRAQWKRRAGDELGAGEDERWLRRANQKVKRTQRGELASALRDSPTKANLDAYLEAGFALPKDGRLLAALLGVCDDAPHLMPVLTTLDSLVDDNDVKNQRLLSQKLDTLILKIGDGEAVDLARSIKDKLA